MLLKSPTETPICAMLSSGAGMRIGPEGREVDAEFVKAAMVAGAIPAQMTTEDMNPPDAAPTERDRPSLLRDALVKLRAEGSPLRGNGMPHRTTVSAAAGWNVSAEELTTAWNALP